MIPAFLGVCRALASFFFVCLLFSKGSFPVPLTRLDTVAFFRKNPRARIVGSVFFFRPFVGGDGRPDWRAIRSGLLKSI